MSATLPLASGAVAAVVSACAAVAAAIVAAIALIYARRQADLAARSAGNAKVSALAALDSNRLAHAAIAVVQVEALCRGYESVNGSNRLYRLGDAYLSPNRGQ